MELSIFKKYDELSEFTEGFIAAFGMFVFGGNFISALLVMIISKIGFGFDENWIYITMPISCGLLCAVAGIVLVRNIQREADWKMLTLLGNLIENDRIKADDLAMLYEVTCSPDCYRSEVESFHCLADG